MPRIARFCLGLDTAVWIATGVSLFAAACGSPTPQAVRFSLEMPDGTTVWGGPDAPHVVPSPDGAHLAFVAGSADSGALWVRATRSPASRRLEATEGATLPFWSPDGQWIAFFAGGKLKKVALSGGAPIALCDVQEGEGGAWNRDGAIVFSPGPGSPLMRVSASGGAPSPVTTLDVAAGERKHAFPQFLPDGRILYLAANTEPQKGAIYVQKPGATERVRVMQSAYRARWSPPGYLLFPRNGALLAQPVDPESGQLTGEPAVVADHVSASEHDGRAAFSVSPAGLLTYRHKAPARRGPIAWYSRDGRRLSEAAPADEYTNFRLSPDEKKLAVTVGTSEMWVFDLATRARTPVAASDAISFLQPPGTQLLIDDWSPHGRFWLARKAGSRELFAIRPEPGAAPRRVAEPASLIATIRLSPDGGWAAYSTADRSQHLFVAAFPSFADRRQVATTGASYPVWRNDGRELFFQNRSGMIFAADVRTSPQLDVGVPTPLFRQDAASGGQTYWPSGDGRRFLVKERDQDDATGEVTVVLNWAAALKP
jgi:Tol biopolymer transport system component